MSAMTEKEVDEYRRRREITVDGPDVPKPVTKFSDAGFPGNAVTSSVINYICYAE